MRKKTKTRKEETCVCFNLRMASRVVTQLYDGKLRQSGLRVTQISLLGVIERIEPVTVKRLAQEIVMDRTTLTRNLEVLARERLIQITSGYDRRERVIEITPRGQKSLSEAFQYWKKAQKRIIKDLGKARVDNLLRELSYVLNRLQR
jgi:DNA-binding MarR family transcriptional regulator